MNSNTLFHSLSITLALAAMTGCNPPGPPVEGSGPIDGTWLQVSGTCNGSNESNSNGTLVVSDLTGAYIHAALGDGCIATTAAVLTYPTASTLTLMTGTTQGNASCSGADQSNEGVGPSSQSSPWTANYVVSGKTLTLTITNSGCSQAGNSNDVGTDTEVDTFTQQ